MSLLAEKGLFSLCSTGEPASVDSMRDASPAYMTDIIFHAFSRQKHLCSLSTCPMAMFSGLVGWFLLSWLHGIHLDKFSRKICCSLSTVQLAWSNKSVSVLW